MIFDLGFASRPSNADLFEKFLDLGEKSLRSRGAVTEQFNVRDCVNVLGILISRILEYSFSEWTRDLKR